MIDDLASKIATVLDDASKPMDLAALVAATGAAPTDLKAALRALWRTGQVCASGPGRWAAQLLPPQERSICYWGRRRTGTS